MKHLFASLLILCICSSNLLAQSIDVEELGFYQRQLASGKSTKKVGTSLAAPGVLILLSGIVMISTANYDRDADGLLEINDPNVGLGAGLVINGLPLTAVGGIIMLAGNSKIKRAQRQLDKISVSYYQRPGQYGLGLTFRF